MSNLSRRKILKGISTASAATVGLGSVSTAAASEDGEVQREELSGSRKKKYVQQVLDTKAFKSLSEEVDNKYGGVVDVSDATVYEVQSANDVQHVISFGVSDIPTAVESSLAFRVSDKSVVFSKALIAKPSSRTASPTQVTKDDINENDSISVTEIGVDSQDNIQTDEREVHKGLSPLDGGLTTQASSECVEPCAFALNAACPGLCGLTGAGFCAIVTFNSGGLASFGCGAFFVLYCLLVDYANPCFYKSSPEADCREIVCPRI